MRKPLLTILATLLCLNVFAQQTRYAVVDLSSIYMRAEPDYESALETQELMGTVVAIVGEEGYWRQIVSPQPYVAWCTEKGIVEISDEELAEYQNAPKRLFTGLYGHIYEAPFNDSPTICDLVGGDIMRFVEEDGDWTKVKTPSGKEGWVPTAQLRVHDGFYEIPMNNGFSGCISEELMENIIATAYKLKGVPYLWGGMTPKGVDCSGLVRWSYLMNGVFLPRNASEMVTCGVEVPLHELKRGDLLFFGTLNSSDYTMKVTHVGIYVGDDYMIHSSHVVRVNSITPDKDDYYENAHKLIAARRL